VPCRAALRCWLMHARHQVFVPELRDRHKTDDAVLKKAYLKAVRVVCQPGTGQVWRVCGGGGGLRAHSGGQGVMSHRRRWLCCAHWLDLTGAASPSRQAERQLGGAQTCAGAEAVRAAERGPLQKRGAKVNVYSGSQIHSVAVVKGQSTPICMQSLSRESGPPFRGPSLLQGRAGDFCLALGSIQRCCCSCRKSAGVTSLGGIA
jgi:hypothetical protein